jgi:hypothetical protein
MHRIIYLSSATQYLKKEEIEFLLEQSRTYNFKNHITGILLYIDGDFIQVLEGEKQTITSLFENIKVDKRHNGVICVLNRSIKKRQFNNWAMGYCATNYSDLKKIYGFENINKEELFNFKDHTALIFLDTFLKSHPDEMIKL